MTPPRAEQATYTFGHHPSVTSSHARRTAADSAAFLLPHIRPHHTVLDVGCGPGTITADLAQHARHVTGVDLADIAIPPNSHANLAFMAGVDANALPFADAAFDVVFCHQLLQHVGDPVGVLREMRRVARPGGVVAAREADYGGFVWWPQRDGLARWLALYRETARACGGQPDAGRRVREWARQAGFRRERVLNSWSSWYYTGEAAAHFGESWAGRALLSNFAHEVVGRGLGTERDLGEISDAWRRWAAEEDGFIVIPNGEMLYRVPEEEEE